jgi:hypothetical protein
MLTTAVIMLTTAVIMLTTAVIMLTTAVIMLTTAVIMFTIGINFSATCSIWFKEKEKGKCINATNCYTAVTYFQ